jgi:octaprenyl-diphosphate synthase
MARGTEAERRMIRSAIVGDDGLQRLADIQDVIESTGALRYTAQRAQDAADQAIDALADIPDSAYRQAMIAIAEFAVKRRS